MELDKGNAEERRGGMVVERIWKDLDGPGRCNALEVEKMEKESQGDNQLARVDVENGG